MAIAAKLLPSDPECSSSPPRGETADRHHAERIAVSQSRPARITPEQFVQFCLQHLRAHGQRITGQRRLIIEALAQVSLPVTAYALLELLEKQRSGVHVVSVYRTLNLLEYHGLAHRVAPTGGYLPCRLGNAPGWHIHLVCQSCSAVEEVAVAELPGIACRAGAYARFEVERSMVGLFGVCEACAARRSANAA